MKLLLIHTYIFINYKIIKDIYISDCKRYLKIDNNLFYPYWIYQIMKNYIKLI